MEETLLHSGHEKVMIIRKNDEFITSFRTNQAKLLEDEINIQFIASLNGHKIHDTGKVSKSDYWSYELKEVVN